ncbi:glutamate 5-kinase [Halobacterium yunchengense]|uniref:glutamate 5-kinase n=1 Tax=Halobacterium yunchengense TaxID=3108497 RepID=UPI00300A6048
MSEGARQRADGAASVDPERVEAAREAAADADRVVVKAGTNSLTDADSRLDPEKLDKLVDDIAALRERGTDVLLVSSGAIGAGEGLLGVDGETVEEDQALSTVGQSQLMRRYSESFDRHDTTTAQLLLTEHDLANPERFTNAQNTVETLLDWGVVPVINENDAVATEEVRIGDNDMLSSSVAIGLGVDLLVTLTDVGGVYTANPKEDPDAERIEAVGANYGAVEAAVEDSAAARFGGIRTKVRRARAAAEHGVPAVIAGSAEPDVLDRIADGDPVGTLFVPVGGDSDE